MSPGIFEYTHLADPRNDIRLMKLRFDRTPRSDSTLSCEIHNFKHKECPPYFALSYAWGQEEFMLSIVVGNTSTLATSSTVHDVLRTLVTARDDNSDADNDDAAKSSEDGDASKDHFWIWIDQICINQRDAAEKSHQVQRMKAIYNRADKVIAWLGPEANDSTLLLEYFQQCAQAIRARDRDAVVRLNSDPQAVAIRDAAFHYFCMRDYWKRLWIVQEYAVARRLEIRVGPATLDAEDLDLCFDTWYELDQNGELWSSEPQVRSLDDDSDDDDAEEEDEDEGEEVDEDENEDEEEDEEEEEEEDDDDDWETNFTGLFECTSISYVEGIVTRRSKFQVGDSEDQDLLEVLKNGLVLEEDYNHVYTSFPQDRVFALLGLASDGVPGLPNYELSCEEVYARTAAAMLRRGRIDILAFSQFPRKLDSEKLPTWAPDWSIAVRMPRGAWIWEDPDSYFHSSGRLGSVNGQRVIVNESNTTIELRGVVVDSIRKVGAEVWDPNWLEPLDAAAAIRFLDEIKQFCAESERVPEGQEESNAASVAGADDEGSFGWPSIKENREARRKVFEETMVELQEMLGTTTTTKTLAAVTKTLSIDPSSHDHQSHNAAHKKVPLEYSSNILEAMRWFHSRRSFISHSGYVGTGPLNAAPGDVVCVFLGAHVPYVIRASGDGSYTLVGDAWVNGIMCGEVLLQNPVVESIVLK